MKFHEQLKRIRRFLRDPNGNIWGHTLLKNIFNDVQRELQVKTRILEDVTVLRVPPFYQSSYIYDWEWPYKLGTKVYKALRDQGDYVFCHRFEPQVNLGFSSDGTDEGIHITQPWEAWMGHDPGEPIRIQFPSNFHAVEMLAYDQEPLEFLPKKNINSYDTTFISRMGEPRWYYREDNLDNSFIPYPLPSTVSWNDVLDGTDPDYVYTFDWEEEGGYLTSVGEKWTVTDETNSREYAYPWESDDPISDDIGIRGMFLFELDFSIAGQYGMIQYISGETADETGTITQINSTVFNQDEGVAIEYVDESNNFLLVYEVTPDEIQVDADESDFPGFLQKYIEQGVISRAYGANTDGRIQSLSDYWGLRFQMGIEAIKRFKSNRAQDRNYRLKTSDIPARMTVRHPRLPDGYPAV